MDPWLVREVWWASTDPIPQVSLGLLSFRVETRDGTTWARLFDAGAPNHADDPWRPATFTNILLRIRNRSDTQLRDGFIYVARSYGVEDGVLILPPRGLNSSVTELRRSHDTERTALELFAGLGSWSFASKAINQHVPDPLRVLAAIDVSEEACNTYQQNHPETRIFAEDVLNAECWPTQSVFLVMGSPPCPIFSSLTGSRGFARDSEGKQAWFAMASMLRATQPTWVLLENVAQIQGHIKDVTKLMRLAGYKPIHIRLVNAASFGPFQRNRWIGLWGRLANMETLHADISMWCPKNPSVTLESFSCIQEVTLDRPGLEFTESEVIMMKNPVYRGKRISGTPWQICGVRPSQKGLTITHLYGKSFTLDDQRLKEFGLWCPFLQLLHRERKFSEWEIVRGHLFPTGMVLPASSDLAVSLLGNSVSPTQCAVGILILLRQLGLVSREKSDGILLQMMDSAQKVTGVTRVSSSQWQRLVPQANPQPVTKEIPLEAMARTQLYEAPQTVSDSSEVSTPNSQDSARCFGHDDCYDLASYESDKDSGIREPDLVSLDSPVEENPLEVPLEWDDATRIFQKMDTFHMGPFPDEEAPPLATHFFSDDQRQMKGQVDQNIPPTIPFDVTLSMPDRDTQARTGQEAERTDPDPNIPSYPQFSPFGSGFQVFRMGPNPVAVPEECGSIPNPAEDPKGRLLSSNSPAWIAARARAMSSKRDEPEESAQETGQTTKGDSQIRDLVVKMKNGNARMAIHQSHPIAILKAVYAGDTFHRIRVNYVRVNVAANTRLTALPQDSYVWVDWLTGKPPAGGDAPLVETRVGRHQAEPPAPL